MANPYQSASRDLLIEELDQVHGITEEELATASIATTCTCQIGEAEETVTPGSDGGTDAESSTDF